MKSFYKTNILLQLLLLLLVMSSCDILDTEPETAMSEKTYWKTTSDLRDACNFLYAKVLSGYDINLRDRMILMEPPQTERVTALA